MSDSKKNLDMAVEIQRKNKRKKMAEGGPISAKTESRPMPETHGVDAHEIAHNAAKHALIEAGMMDAPEGDMKKPKVQPKAGPDMVKSSVFTARVMKPGDHLMEEAKPESDKAQPPKTYNEEGPDRHGPSTKSLKMKKMAEGGEINDDVSMHDAEEDDVVHPEGLESDNDEMGDKDAMLDHFAEGGEVDDEEALEHHASIAAAIMAKKAAKHALESGSEDEDEAEMFAEGGQVGLESNEEEQPNMYYGRNKAALKENYGDDLNEMDQPEDSNLTGDEEESESENKNARISQMRKRVMAKRR